MLKYSLPPTAKPAEDALGEEPQQEGQGAEAQGEKAQIPPVRSSRPETGGQRGAHGLLVRPTAAAAAAVPPAADPQPAAAALQLPDYITSTTQVCIYNITTTNCKLHLPVGNE